jgi:hypothetical protein
MSAMKRRRKADPFAGIARKIKEMANDHAESVVERATVISVDPLTVKLLDQEDGDIILSHEDDDFDAVDSVRRTDIEPGDLVIVIRERDGWYAVGFISDRSLWPISLTDDSRP